MRSVLELAKKINKVSIINVLRRLLRKDQNQTVKSLKTCVNKLDVRVEVEIDKLRTTNQHRYKQEYINQGVAFFDLPIRETPHFQFIKNYQDDPELKFEKTAYWRLVDFALAIHKERVGGAYIHNQREEIVSAMQRCADFIKLFEDIKSNGLLYPIDVIATYDGKYVMTDGFHRASIACAMGFAKVPVRIMSVDRALLNLLEILRDTYPDNGHKALYTPIDHSIFYDWKSLRDNTRWLLIKDEFEWNGKKILDIGTYTGYFSHKIAKLGGNVTGIEIDNKRLDQAKMINTLLDSNVVFLSANFIKYVKGKQFDCILFFSVLHWILKDKGIEGVREALDILCSASPVLFFDMGQDSEPKMRTQEWTRGLTINRETIPDLIISNSKYEYCQHLGTGDTGRDLFKFSRKPIN